MGSLSFPLPIPPSPEVPAQNVLSGTQLLRVYLWLLFIPLLSPYFPRLQPHCLLIHGPHPHILLNSPPILLFCIPEHRCRPFSLRTFPIPQFRPSSFLSPSFLTVPVPTPIVRPNFSFFSAPFLSLAQQRDSSSSSSVPPLPLPRFLISLGSSFNLHCVEAELGAGSPGLVWGWGAGGPGWGHGRGRGGQLRPLPLRCCFGCCAFDPWPEAA